MPTIMQQRAIEKTVENGGNVTAAMREVGYAEATVNNPSNLTNSKGYRERLQILGLNEELITTALVEDIRDKKGKRVQELSLAADLLGMKKMAITIANKVTADEEQEEKDTPEYRAEMQEYANVFEQYLKAKISNQTRITINIPS